MRGRALAVTQMAYMGGMAAGAAAWGKIASLTDVSSSLTIASGAAVLALGATVRLRLGGRVEEDLTPSRHWSEPSVAIPIEEDRGPVLCYDRVRKRQFHIGSEPPALRYFIAEEIPARRRSAPSR